MVIKTYEDGSEFTEKHVMLLAAWAVLATAASIGVVYLNEKRNDRKYAFKPSNIRWK